MSSSSVGSLCFPHPVFCRAPAIETRRTRGQLTSGGASCSAGFCRRASAGGGMGKMRDLSSSEPADVAAVPLVLGERRPCLRRQQGKKPPFPTAVLEMPARVRTGLMAPDGSRTGAWRCFNCAFATAMVASLCSWGCCELRDAVRVPGGVVWWAHCIAAPWLQGMCLPALELCFNIYRTGWHMFKKLQLEWARPNTAVGMSLCPFLETVWGCLWGTELFWEDSVVWREAESVAESVHRGGRQGRDVLSLW